jgi:hypothetical protein
VAFGCGGCFGLPSSGVDFLQRAHLPAQVDNDPVSTVSGFVIAARRLQCGLGFVLACRS